MAAAVGVGVVVGAAAALLVRLIEWTEHGAEWMAEATNVGAWAYVVLVPAGLLI